VISLIGRGLVLLALAAAVSGCVVGSISGIRKRDRGGDWTRNLTFAFGSFMVMATLLMEYALITHDFSVGYVAQVGSLSTPLHITIVSLWSALEGSILFWGFVLGIYAMVFAWTTRGRHPQHTAYSLAVLLGVAVFFCFLVASVADPFAAVEVVPPDGPGPNPLLQNHVLMIIHPPALYLGFVGMSVPFAMACSALLAGRLDAAWMQMLRRWTLLVWSFLTLGILLGGWWSYEVLGWGGYWAWDPVENASFMPWLAATAFLHSAMVTARKGLFSGWSLVLVIASFLLTLLGTFMTRSGVFNSVHSFTQSPIGPVFLVFIAIVLVFSVILLSARLDTLAAKDASIGSAVSREGSFLLNNLLFVCFTFTVLLGTLYPLIVEAISENRISVGQPYFDAMSAPICLALLFLMGVGPVLPWGRSEPGQVRQLFVRPAVFSVVVGALSFALGVRSPWVIGTFSMATFAAWASVRELSTPVLLRMRKQGEALPKALLESAIRTRRRFGGHIVHLGVVAMAVSVASATHWREDVDLTLTQDEPVEVFGYTLTYLGAENQDQPHRVSQVGRFSAAAGGRDLGVLEPRFNRYKKRGDEVPSPAVYSGPKEDLYLSLLRVDDDGTASLRVVVQPMVAWLWVGGLMMVFGSFIASFPERILRRRSSVEAQGDVA